MAVPIGKTNRLAFGVVAALRSRRRSSTPTTTPTVRTVLRRCRVCEWHDQLLETEGSDPDCPWCHAPTVATRIAEVSGISEDGEDGKNPHATALGRLGGVKGGRARAQTLSAKRRREIASKAARARWNRR